MASAQSRYPARDQGTGFLFALQQNAMFRLVAGQGDGLIHQGLVGHHPAGLDTAGAGDDDLGFGIVDAGSELPGREAAEDDGVDRPQARAGQHGNGCLGHHGHVDDDPIPLGHPQPGQDPGEPSDLVPQRPVAVGTLGAGGRAVVDQGACSQRPASRWRSTAL